MAYQPPAAPYHAVDPRNPWNTGLIIRFPWLGTGALILSVLGLVASVSILVAVDHVPISAWRFQPTVYLAILSALTTITLRLALSQGLNIAWWRKAMKEHTRIAELHQYWEVCTNLWSASVSGQRFNLVALACIWVSLAPINGPLLQRAVTVDIVTIPSTTTLQVSLAPEVPTGWSGYMSSSAEHVSLLSGNFVPVVDDYYKQAPIAMANTGCRGICSTVIQGAGFSVNCSSSTVPFNLTSSFFSNGTASRVGTAVVFSTQFADDVYTSANNASLNIQYKETPNCSGDLVVKNCTINGASVLYPVIIDGNQSTIALAPNTTSFSDQIQYVTNLSAESLYDSGTTLGGIFLALSSRFDSSATLEDGFAVGYSLYSSGATINAYAVLPSDPTYVPSNNCSLHFSDPLRDLLRAARELIFRTAIAAAADSANITAQLVNAQQTTTEAIYVANYIYLAIAIFLPFIAVLCVTVLYHGYWLLGRPVSLSPIEIAKAFNAPLLRGNGDSNGSARLLLRDVGAREVRYGAVGIVGGVSAMAPQDIHAGLLLSCSPTSQPDGVLVGGGTDEASMTDGGSSSNSIRLQMADPQLVLVPRPGWRFTG